MYGGGFHLLHQLRQSLDVASSEGVNLALELHILAHGIPSTVIIVRGSPVGSQPSIVDLTIVDVAQLQSSALR